MDNFKFKSNSNNLQKRSIYCWVALLATILALIVIMLGAYTRLTDAGLGCPDWPGCYGKLVLSSSHATLLQEQAEFPQNPIVLHKAWTEMAHRYLASILGIIIFGLAIAALVRRRHVPTQPLWTPWILVVVTVFQALLGMWTVTLQLLPLVVMTHLLGGMTIVALLCWLMLSTKPQLIIKYYRLSVLWPWAIVGLIIIALQIFLGAWTSTNYAALACPDFPCCQGTLFPHMNWIQGFNFASPIGPNYEGGRLTMDARVAIHMAHRFGGLITTLYLAPFALFLIFNRNFSILRKLGLLLIGLLVIQICLGILNVAMMLPLPIAVAHNGVAALVLLTMVTIVQRICLNRN